MATVHDQSYRRYDGTRLPPGRAWRLIAATGLRGLLARKSFLALLVLAWLPWLVRAVQIYTAVTYPMAAEFLRVDERLFLRFLDQQGLFVFFVTVYAGSGLIAHDRRANALPIYLSRPITRTEYVLGKLGVLLAVLAGITLVPGLLLLVLEALFSGSLAMVRESPTIVLAILISGLLTTGVAAVSMLALSALTDSARSAAISFAGAIFFTNAVARVLGAVMDSSAFAWVSVTANLDRVADALFDLPVRQDVPLGVAIAVLTVVVGLSILVIERRVRPVEVVS